MNDSIEEIIKQKISECANYAEAEVDKLYKGITLPSKTASTHGALLTMCIKNGGSERQKELTNSDLIKSCNSFADKEAGEIYNPVSNPTYFGAVKGVILDLCLENGGIEGYEKFVAGSPHGLPKSASKPPEKSTQR